MNILFRKINLYYYFCFFLFTVQLKAQCNGTSLNQLINPSFEIPVQTNIGNNIITWPLNGWNGFGANPNIVRTNGGPSTGGPNNAHQGVQYLDVVGSSADFFQQFNFQCNTQVFFSGYFSVRDNRTSTGRIDLLRVNSNNTTTLVASSNQLNMPSTANIWYLASGSTVLLPGTYRFNITMGEDSNFDDACFSFNYPIINTGSYGPLCENSGDIILTGTPTDSFGTWSGSGVVDNGNGTAVFNPSGLGGTIVQVTYSHFNTAGFGCTQSTNITVNPSIIPIFTQVPSICSGATLSALPLTSSNGITGAWSPSLNNAVRTTYTFTPNTGQCTNTATMTITVISPEINQSSATQYFCQGGTVADLLPQGNDILWYTSLNSSLPLDTNTVLENNVAYFASRIINSCESQQRIQVRVFTNCEIPKGVSANGDGLNDWLDLSFMNGVELQIINRYGMVVYTNSNYYKEWNGKDINSNSLPSGVYYYVIKNTNNENKTGWIYLTTD
jgi:gliding motility-associated-like protein